MQEIWAEIPEFPNYAVSNHGHVINQFSGHRKVATCNQQGIPSVLLMKDGESFRRSVTVLVAHAFLPEPTSPLYDTPINLDGDRSNNHIDNLAWRPRWFASKYHAQLKVSTPYGYNGGVTITKTGERFDKLRDCSTRYGLLEKELIMAAWNNQPVSIIWSHVQLDD